jgi:Tol biopolymer transport system component
MNADGSSQTRITDPGGTDDPAWSPDGTEIVFSRHGDIYVMNADGSNQTRLTNTSEWDEEPAWSPDGKRIAFSRDYDIYVMNADGSNQTNLTNRYGLDEEPAWSPDGKKIAFSRDNDIYVMNADGSSQTNLTNSHALDVEPAWSPDGEKIVFSSLRDGSFEIYVMDADDGNQTHLTGRSPAWRWGNLFLVVLFAAIVLIPIITMRRLRLSGKSRTSELAVVALALGIAGFLGTPLIVWNFITPLADVLAIAFGGVAMRQTGKNRGVGGRGMAIAGLVLGIAGLVSFAAIVVVMFIRALSYPVVSSHLFITAGF